VDEIVELSIRYGIITPYTSFLVEETERALREEGREEIAREVQATSVPAPASGQDAVERSAGERKLAEAEAPVAVPMPEGLGAGPVDEYGHQTSPVRYVGDKTFIYHDGVWTDTTFDSDKMTPVPVSFGSDDYFALVSARPEWGRYLALGDHLIVVLDGTAYEIREGEGPPEEGEGLPEAAPLDAPPGETPEAAPSAEAAPATETSQNLGNILVEFLMSVVDTIAGFFTD
jgi:Ca-activated chloride channel family protein